MATTLLQTGIPSFCLISEWHQDGRQKESVCLFLTWNILFWWPAHILRGYVPPEKCPDSQAQQTLRAFPNEAPDTLAEALLSYSPRGTLKQKGIKHILQGHIASVWQSWEKNINRCSSPSFVSINFRLLLLLLLIHTSVITAHTMRSRDPCSRHCKNADGRRASVLKRLKSKNKPSSPSCCWDDSVQPWNFHWLVTQHFTNALCERICIALPRMCSRLPEGQVALNFTFPFFLVHLGLKSTQSRQEFCSFPASGAERES